MEFNSIHHFISKFPPLPSHPLFSTIITLHTLILLYAPSFFFRIALSPVLNSTGIILLFLLKLGANERLEKESHYLEPRVFDHNYEQLTSLEQRFLDLVDRNQTHRMQPEFNHDLGPESNSQDGNTYSMESSQVVEKEVTIMEMESKQVDTPMKFLKWNLKAPLEIIYEEYEGEEEDDNEDNNGNTMAFGYKQGSGFEKYPSLSMYYPESEADSSSDDDFPVNGNWEMEDDEREELIEISVDRYEKRSIEFCRVEEDNLIEIDIFPERS